jgi:hypothetical protein
MPLAVEILKSGAKLSFPKGRRAAGSRGIDEQVTVYSKDFDERQRKPSADESLALVQGLASPTEKDPLVRQDLEIMLKRVQRPEARASSCFRRLEIPYVNAAERIFGRASCSLLDDQVKPERRRGRAGAPAPLRGNGSRAIVRRRSCCRSASPSASPTRSWSARLKLELEKSLQTSALVVKGIGPLFEKYGIKGYEEPYAALQKQLAAYDVFVREKVLPRARQDFRQPPETLRLSNSNRLASTSLPTSSWCSHTVPPAKFRLRCRS